MPTKYVEITWHRGDLWERKYLRKAAIANARRYIRQYCRKQLKSIGHNFNDSTEDTFEHPKVRLPWFD
jgi:hypothetical protein